MLYDHPKIGSTIECTLALTANGNSHLLLTQGGGGGGGRWWEIQGSSNGAGKCATAPQGPLTVTKAALRASLGLRRPSKTLKFSSVCSQVIYAGDGGWERGHDPSHGGGVLPPLGRVLAGFLSATLLHYKVLFNL